MSGLQTATDITALVFMGSILIAMLALLMTVLVIKHKINKLHDMIEDKINTFEKFAQPVEWIMKSFKKK